jgi:hypothetical protein
MQKPFKPEPNQQDKKGRDKKARRKRGAPFVSLPHWLLKSPAWGSLSTQARAIYIEIMVLFNGGNNGRIALSTRDAAIRCNIKRNTAMRAIDELTEKGFIECTRGSSFTAKRLSREWRSTALPCNLTGQLPSKAFMRWGAEKWGDDERRGGRPRRRAARPNGHATKEINEQAEIIEEDASA